MYAYLADHWTAAWLGSILLCLLHVTCRGHDISIRWLLLLP